MTAHVTITPAAAAALGGQPGDFPATPELAAEVDRALERASGNVRQSLAALHRRLTIALEATAAVAEEAVKPAVVSSVEPAEAEVLAAAAAEAQVAVEAMASARDVVEAKGRPPTEVEAEGQRWTAEEVPASSVAVGDFLLSRDRHGAVNGIVKVERVTHGRGRSYVEAFYVWGRRGAANTVVRSEGTVERLVLVEE